MTRQPGQRHLDANRALDYLEQRLDAASRQDVETHLGRPCHECHERLRRMGEMIATMRGDRSPEVPAEFTQRAFDVFVPQARPDAIRTGLDSIARLLFDSLAAPLPAAVRRSVGEARRLRYALGEDSLELEIEREDGSSVAIRGRLGAPSAELWGIVVIASGETLTVSPGQRGEFAFDAVPAGPIALRATGPGGTFLIEGIGP